MLCIFADPDDCFVHTTVTGFKGTRSNLYNLAELIGECEDGILGEKYLDQVKLDIMKADGDACRGILEVDDMLGR